MAEQPLPKVLEVVSCWRAEDFATGRTVVNFSQQPANTAWEKMDMVIDYLSSRGWEVIDHRFDPEERVP